MLGACAVICRKTTFTISVSAVMLPDANFLSSRAQNWGFCARLRQARHLESAVLPQESPGRRSFGIGSIGKAQLRLSAPSGCNWQHGGQSNVPRTSQCYFYWKKNREKKIYHTVLVELNGFIHSELVGTPLEGDSYLFMGPRAYDSPNFLR